jgi:hypothetical protein
MPWLVPLLGHEFELSDLPTWMQGGAFEVQKRETDYVLTSPRFDELTDAAEVRRIAEEVLSFINALGRLKWSEFQPVRLSDVEYEGPNGERSIFVALAGKASGRSKFTATVRRADGTVVPEVAPGEFNDWIAVASSDHLVERALTFLDGHTVTWSDLYRALEVVKADAGGNISRMGWASSTALDHFKHTANSYSVLGVLARHGRDRGGPPADPMSFGEARQLVFRTVRAWIDSKAGSGRACSE